MLTSELIKPFLQRNARRLSLKPVDMYNQHTVQTAREVIALLQQHIGQTRKAWELALEDYEGTRLDYPMIRGLAKVLTDAATFTTYSLPFSPIELRQHLFARGPVFAAPDVFHPQGRQEVVAAVAEALGMNAEQVEHGLFADCIAEQIISDTGPSWTPEALLARYQLELARGVLYGATQVQVEVHGHYKDLWKYLKLFRLMFWAEPMPDGGYRLELDGPISPFVQQTTRYGRAFAAWMPALLLCEHWKLQAQVRTPLSPEPLIYQLDESSQLSTHFKASGLYDSRLEQQFAQEFADFEEKFGSKRGRWRLQRECEVLLVGGDTVMIPDFLAIHERNAQRQILIELVGYWHPNYLARKLEKVRAANCQHLLLLVYEDLNVTAEHFEGVASEVVFFKQKPIIKEVLAMLEAMAQRLYGPLANS